MNTNSFFFTDSEGNEKTSSKALDDIFGDDDNNLPLFREKRKKGGVGLRPQQLPEIEYEAILYHSSNC